LKESTAKVLTLNVFVNLFLLVSKPSFVHAKKDISCNIHFEFKLTCLFAWHFACKKSAVPNKIKLVLLVVEIWCDAI